MWGVFLLSTSSPSAEPSFSEQYERGYNTFKPVCAGQSTESRAGLRAGYSIQRRLSRRR